MKIKTSCARTVKLFKILFDCFQLLKLLGKQSPFIFSTGRKESKGGSVQTLSFLWICYCPTLTYNTVCSGSQAGLQTAQTDNDNDNDNDNILFSPFFNTIRNTNT